MEWKTSRLGDVCQMIKRGVAPKYLEEGGICVVNQKCIRDHSVNYDLARRHNSEAKKVNEERYVRVGDVLVNSTGTGTLGRVAQVRSAPSEPTTVDTHVTIVRPKQDFFHDDFFGYMLTKIEEEITSAGKGASGQTELARAKLENEFFVSYPDSIPEQKRVVAILDQAFADIEKVRVNAKQNLKNARELFDSYLNQVFTGVGSCNDWHSVRLKSIVDRLTNGFVGPTRDIYKDSGVPYLLARQVKNNILKFDGRTYVSDEFNIKNKKSLLKKGDVLLVQSGHIGHSAVVPAEHEGHNCHAMIVITPKDELTSDFLSFYFSFLLFTGRISEIRSGSTVPHLTCKLVKELLIPLPPVSEQKRIVENIRMLAEQTKQLEASYELKLKSLDELKKSLLQKAFSGELTKSKGIAA